MNKHYYASYFWDYLRCKCYIHMLGHFPSVFLSNSMKSSLTTRLKKLPEAWLPFVVYIARLQNPLQHTRGCSPHTDRSVWRTPSCLCSEWIVF
jgi:hypothetical protein